MWKMKYNDLIFNECVGATLKFAYEKNSDDEAFVLSEASKRLFCDDSSKKNS